MTFMACLLETRDPGGAIVGSEALGEKTELPFAASADEVFFEVALAMMVLLAWVRAGREVSASPRLAFKV
jgi:hypothetical protein